MSSGLIILDRDGVINHDSDNYIKTLEEWAPIEGSIEAIVQLSQAGFQIAVATNQSGLGRGYFDEFVLANMHSLLCDLVEEQGGLISGIFYCPHLPGDKCTCRKPATGLLQKISDELQLSVQGSWFVGDSEKDIDCALAMDCKPILVLTGKGRLTQSQLCADKLAKVKVFDDLCSASLFILSAEQQASLHD